MIDELMEELHEFNEAVELCIGQYIRKYEDSMEEAPELEYAFDMADDLYNKFGTGIEDHYFKIARKNPVIAQAFMYRQKFMMMLCDEIHRKIMKAHFEMFGDLAG